jgi:hypothetical protein
MTTPVKGTVTLNSFQGLAFKKRRKDAETGLPELRMNTEIKLLKSFVIRELCSKNSQNIFFFLQVISQ